MVHGKNRIPYWIDRRLSGLAGPDYTRMITISFGLPIEPEDSQYGESRIRAVAVSAAGVLAGGRDVAFSVSKVAGPAGGGGARRRHHRDGYYG